MNRSPHRFEGLWEGLPLPDKAGSEASQEAVGPGSSAKAVARNRRPGSNREAGKIPPATREAARKLLEFALRTDPATRELPLPGVPRVRAGWKGAADEGEVRRILLRSFGGRGGLKLYLERGREWYRNLALRRWASRNTGPGQ